MPFFAVEIQETLQLVVPVEAENEQEAQQQVQERYKNAEIVLGSEEFVKYEISTLNISQEEAKELYLRENPELTL